MRRLRMYDPNFYCEVTIRSIEGEFSFDPNDLDLRLHIYGLIAEAARRTGVAIFIFHFMSNHYHGLYGFSSPEQLITFLAYLHGNLAKLANEVRGRSGAFWSKPKVLQVATDAETLALRYKYIMSQAVKAEICQHPGQFPGVSAVDALLYGTPLVGRRVDRSRRCRDELRLVCGAKADAAYETLVEVPLSVPRCWADLSAAELRQLLQGIAHEVAGVKPAERPAGQLPEMPAPELPVPGTCLIHENTGECLPSCDPELPLTPASELEQPNGLQAAPPAKVHVPQRQGEDGGPYRHGKPKSSEGTKKSGKMPLLLSANRQLAKAYQERYELGVQAYYQAKMRWRRSSKHREGALRSAKLTLPAWFLLGTLPLRVGG